MSVGTMSRRNAHVERNLRMPTTPLRERLFISGATHAAVIWRGALPALWPWAPGVESGTVIVLLVDHVRVCMGESNGAREARFEEKAPEHSLTLLGSRRSVIGAWRRRCISSGCSDSECHVGRHRIPFRPDALRGGIVGRQPGDVLCPRPAARRKPA